MISDIVRVRLLLTTQNWIILSSEILEFNVQMFVSIVRGLKIVIGENTGSYFSTTCILQYYVRTFYIWKIRHNFKWGNSQGISLSLNSGEICFLKEKGNNSASFGNVCYNTTAILLVFVYWIIWSVSRASDKSLEIDLVARRAVHNLTTVFFLIFSGG